MTETNKPEPLDLEALRSQAASIAYTYQNHPSGALALKMLALIAEVERLLEELGQSQIACTEIGEKLFALHEENARLKAALEPFCRPLWVRAHEGWADDEQIKTHCTVGHLRNADKALKGE